MIEVILKLDKSSRARLSWIQSFAASFGIVPKAIYGHITVGAIADENLESCKDKLCGRQAFAVDFERIDILSNAPVVAAMAVKSNILVEVRRTVSEDADWIPCVELLRDSVMNLGWVRTAMGEMFQPFSARIERIEFMKDGACVDAIDLPG